MNLIELCKAANIECGCKSVEIKGIKSNSEKVEKGDLFVCVSGLKNDGHLFVKEAQKRGAAAILAEKQVDSDLPTVYAANTRKVLPLICDAACGYPSKKLKLVAVTGTNGKTSITYLLKSIFESAMIKSGLIGTVSCFSGDKIVSKKQVDSLSNMTTPDPEELFEMLATMADDGVEYVFMETSSHALALEKLNGLEFEAAIFTNLTPEHLDFHKSMEEYFAAKKKLFEKSKKNIINVDDPYGKKLFDLYGKNSVGCSLSKKCCDYFADDIIDNGIFGSSYRLVSHGKQFSVKSALVGKFNIMNTLQAAACASELGISPGEIKRAIASMNGVKGRLERVRTGEITDYSVFVDYAHTPDALENLLETMSNIRECHRRIVLVFGCGGDRDKSKRRKMGEIAARYSDFTVVTSDNSRSENPTEIISEIISGMSGSTYKVIENRKEAIEYVIKNARKGDIILLAGKGHEEYEIDRSGKHFFDEKKIVTDAVKKYCIEEK